MRRCLLVLLCIAAGVEGAAIAIAQTPGAADALAKGDASFRKGEFGDAMRFYREAADAGNPVAKLKLDHMSGIQPGDKIDVEAMEQASAAFKKGRICDAVSLYSRAAQAGNSAASVRLGQVFQSWTNLPCTAPYIAGQPSLKLGEAMRWFITAAKAGNTEGMQELADIYLGGIGVPKDLAEGRQWLQLAADRGDHVAEMRLQGLDKSPK